MHSVLNARNHLQYVALRQILATWRHYLYVDFCDLIGCRMDSRLGDELARLRQVKGRSVSLREVERQTGISNEYLSQLERGIAKKPAPDVLQKLAKFYQVPYETLLVSAGYLKEKAEARSRRVIPRDVEAMAQSAQFSGEEWDEVKNFMTFLATKRKPGAK